MVVVVIMISSILAVPHGACDPITPGRLVLYYNGKNQLFWRHPILEKGRNDVKQKKQVGHGGLNPLLSHSHEDGDGWRSQTLYVPEAPPG